jgi:hypothetical protein
LLHKQIYQLTKFTFGSHVLELYCLQSASTDFDLTGQLVWPGAMLMNGYLSENADILQGCSVLELGSGVGKCCLFPPTIFHFDWTTLTLCMYLVYPSM